MKNLMLLAFVTALLTSTFATAEVHETIIKNLRESTRTYSFEVERDSYVFNVNGYACQWPGLKIADWMLEVSLNHDRKFGSDENHLAIGIKNPNHQYCSAFAGATDVFGKGFKEGAQLPMTVKNRLDQVEREIIDETQQIKQKLIRETINININGQELESVREIEVPNL